MPQDLRTQTLDLVNTNQPCATGSQVAALISAWLRSLDEEDLAGTSPGSLAPVLWQGFTAAATREAPGCEIARLRYADGRGGMASALLILNDDMPYLVDSIVMAMRKQKVAVSGVMNAVLPVRRDAAAWRWRYANTAPRSNHTSCACCRKTWPPMNWPR
jgi:glutamate dehydrogenase